MIGLIITSVFVGIILVLVIIISIVCIIDKKWSDAILGILYIMALIVCEILIILMIQNFQSEPTALDVYRGLTELEITSDNGVIKDTVVIFKNK